MLTIYLISLILVLFPVCLIITNEIYKILNNYIFQYYQLIKNKKNTFKLLQTYIKQKKWLSCILEIEKKIQQKEEFLADYYNALGYCYYYIKIYNLAEYYYDKAINKNPKKIITLCNLAKIYMSKKQYKNAYNIYHKVIELDKYNKIAKKQIEKLNKYL
nr:hypothetical protein [Calliblepharis sp.]